LPRLAMRCRIVAPGDVCPLRERRFAGPGDLVRGARTTCFIPSSLQQPIFSPRFRAVWSVNAKTQAAAGYFWTVPTPARDGGAAWRTAATEIRPGSTTGARRVDLAVAIIGLGRDRVVRVPATAALSQQFLWRDRKRRTTRFDGSILTWQVVATVEL
jgi:hypothetical protein